MKKKNYFIGACLVLALLSCFISKEMSARSRKEANGVVIIEQEEKKEKQKAIAECGFLRPMRVSSFISNPPFGWTEDLGRNQLVSRGFGVQIFDALAKELKLRYEAVGYRSYQTAVNALKRGDLDLLIGVYTPNTLGKGTTTIYPSMFTNVFTVYYPKQKAFSVSSYAKLAGKKGIIRREENIYPLFSSQITDEMDVSLVNTAKKAFEMLMRGEADYLIGSPYAVEAELRRYKLHEDIVAADHVILDAGMYFVLTTNTDCYKLKNLLSKKLAEYVADKSAVEKKLRQDIDSWGNRFRQDEKLEVIGSKYSSSNSQTTEEDDDENYDEDEDEDEDDEAENTSDSN